MRAFLGAYVIPFALPGYGLSLAVGMALAAVGAWWPWAVPAGLVLLLAGQALPPDGAAARVVERRGLPAAAVPLVLAGHMAAGGGLSLLALAGAALAVLPAAPLADLRDTAYLRAVMDWAVPLFSAPNGALGGAALAGGAALMAVSLSYPWEPEGIGARQWFVTLPLALLFLAGGAAVLFELAAGLLRGKSR